MLEGRPAHPPLLPADGDLLADRMGASERLPRASSSSEVQAAEEAWIGRVVPMDLQANRTLQASLGGRTDLFTVRAVAFSASGMEGVLVGIEVDGLADIQTTSRRQTSGHLLCRILQALTRGRIFGLAALCRALLTQHHRDGLLLTLDPWSALTPAVETAGLPFVHHFVPGHLPRSQFVHRDYYAFLIREYRMTCHNADHHAHTNQAYHEPSDHW